MTLLLLWLAGLLTGVAFAAGISYGAWVQRRVKAEERIAAIQREAVQALAEERYEEPDQPPDIGHGHPYGPPPMSYEDAHLKKKSRVSEIVRKFGVGK